MYLGKRTVVFTMCPLFPSSPKKITLLFWCETECVYSHAVISKRKHIWLNKFIAMICIITLDRMSGQLKEQTGNSRESWTKDMSLKTLTATTTVCQQRQMGFHTAQHSTAQHSSAQHSSAQHSSAQHSLAQHSSDQISTAQLSTCLVCAADAGGE